MQTCTLTPGIRWFDTGRARQRTVCLALLLAPLWVCAQPDGKGPPAATGVMATQPASRDISLAEVSDRLGLNPAQQGLWDAFKGSVDAYTNGYYRQKPTLPSPEEAATRQIGHLVDKLQNRLAALEYVEAAAKNLYASLTPEQQKTANEWLVLSIPTFSPSSTRSGSDACGQGSRPAAGQGPRHGGTGGSMAGPMMGN